MAAAHSEILTSTDPTGGAAAWTATPVDGANYIKGIACPSASLCVAVDDVGNLLASTDPTGGSSAWTVTDIDGSNNLNRVGCSPTGSLCVAVDSSGNLLTSTDPTGGASSWTSHSEPGTYIDGVSCPSSGLCVAVDQGGNVIVGGRPPVSSSPPSIRGVARQGSRVAELHGRWNNAPKDYLYQWMVCRRTGTGCVNIRGASSRSLLIGASEVGHRLRVVETARNPFGSGKPAISAPTAVIAPSKG